jgi:hypothetical protein
MWKDLSLVSTIGGVAIMSVFTTKAPEIKLQI